jgi:predicted dinucleotide-binding enzyme
MKIAIVGKGNVGTALAAGLKRTGHEIRFGHRDPKEPGSLKSARYLEPMAMLMMQLGSGLKMGTNIGYRLVKC